MQGKVGIEVEPGSFSRGLLGEIPRGVENACLNRAGRSRPRGCGKRGREDEKESLQNRCDVCHCGLLSCSGT